MDECVFDFNITPDELKFLFIKDKTKEEYLLNSDVRKRMHDLFVLYIMREDIYRAGEIRKKIFNRKEAI